MDADFAAITGSFRSSETYPKKYRKETFNNS